MAKRKWDHLKDVLPTLPPDASFGDALVAQMDALRGRDIKALVRELEQCQYDKDIAQSSLDLANLGVEASTRVLTEALEALGLDSVEADGVRYTPTGEPYPQVRDKQAFLGWARDHMPDVIREEFPWQTLKATVKHHLETSAAIPDGVDVFFQRKFSRTKV